MKTGFLKNGIKKAKKEKRTGNRIKMDKRTKKGKLISMGYLFPSVAGVLLFFVLPFFVVIYYSMVDNPINNELDRKSVV